MIQQRTGAVLLLFMTALASHAVGPDYEQQFGHSVRRWMQGLEMLRDSSPKASVQLVFLCKDAEQARSLTGEYTANASTVERGEWLGYTFKVTVETSPPREDVDLTLWMRRQFFLGVAYACDLDGIWGTNEHSL